MPITRLILVFVAASAGILLAGSDGGVKPDEVLIGQCAALTGPAQGLGSGMNLGLRAALDEANAKGGVAGRKIRLKAADDAYDPEKTVDCTAKLVEEDGVFALAGFVGTPTAKVALPIVEEMKVPLIGLFTGAMLLREPVQRYVFNVRASYDDETEALVKHLTGTMGLKKIAVFYQNDSFDEAGLSGTTKALAARGMTLTAKSAFERNTLAVKTGVAAVLAADPDAVIIIGPYKPSAEFVRRAREAGMKKAVLAAISFVGTENLIADLGAQADGILISQVVPSPTDTTAPLACEFQAALKSADPKAVPSYVSFEGYLSGRVLLAALEKTGVELTREKLVHVLAQMSSFEIGGMKLGFSPQRHQASTAVYLTVVKAGKAVALGVN